GRSPPSRRWSAGSLRARFLGRLEEPMSADPANTVTAGKVVSIHYTLTDDEGAILDSSEGRAPLDYLHGADNIVAGLEAGLAGHATGDSFRVDVAPEVGYGPH